MNKFFDRTELHYLIYCQDSGEWDETCYLWDYDQGGLEHIALPPDPLFPWFYHSLLDNNLMALLVLSLIPTGLGTPRQVWGCSEVGMGRACSQTRLAGLGKWRAGLEILKNCPWPRPAGQARASCGPGPCFMLFFCIFDSFRLKNKGNSVRPAGRKLYFWPWQARGPCNGQRVGPQVSSCRRGPCPPLGVLLGLIDSSADTYHNSTVFFFLYASSALATEATTCFRALWAQKIGITHVEIQTDWHY